MSDNTKVSGMSANAGAEWEEDRTPHPQLPLSPSLTITRYSYS